MLTNPQVFVVEVKNVKGEVVFSTAVQVNPDHTTQTNGVATNRQVREALMATADLDLGADFLDQAPEEKVSIAQPVEAK